MSPFQTILSLLSAQEKLLEHKSFDCYSKSQQHLKKIISEAYMHAEKNGTVSDFLKNELPLIKVRVEVMSRKIDEEVSFFKGYFSRVLNRPVF